MLYTDITDIPCKLWIGRRSKDGYGLVEPGPNKLDDWAHRQAWKETYGPIPKGIFVLHQCDTPPCWEAEHLFLGTKSDNMKDCIAKKRLPQQNLTHCKHGHSLDDAYIVQRINRGYGKGQERICRQCQKQRSHAWWIS